MNRKQQIAIAIVVLGVLMVSSTQLSDIFGEPIAKTIVSISAILNSILGGAMTVLNSDTATFNDTKALPGVESITVNRNATQTLAAQAVDPNEAKVEVKPSDAKVVETIAKNGSH